MKEQKKRLLSAFKRIGRKKAAENGRGAQEAEDDREKDGSILEKKGKSAEELENGAKKRKKKKAALWKRVTALLLTVAVLLVAVLAWRNKKAEEAAAASASVNTAIASRRDISSELSSTGTLAAKDTYSISSLVEGDVISADFEEGDEVEKGQILYEIDKSSMESSLTSAVNSLSRAQTTYDDAVEDYNQALSDYSGNVYRATETGYINELKISAGDRVSNGTNIATLYSDDVMKIRIPFLSGEAAAIGAGMGGVLTLTDTAEQVVGTVTAVAAQEVTLTGGRIVRYVTIEVANPGGLTTSTAATAQIGEFVGSEDGVFAATIDKDMSAELSTSVEVASLLVHEGDYVTKGTPVFAMTSDTAEDLIKDYKDTMDNAQERLESAQNSLDTTQDNYDNYTITAPISGQVITKNYKVGDTIERNSNSSTTVATIYDLSELTFEMSIDELDILSVKVGQKVTVTADALEGQSFTGEVTKISLESSYSNGVTTYPVTVTMDEVGNLLPGMNVDGVITLEEATDALSVPSDALMRGSQVYVKDDTVTEQKGAVPAGFRAVEVETGVVSDSFVEIKSGLSEGDEVYVAASSVSSSANMMGGMMPGGMGADPGGGMPGGGGQGGGNRGGGQGGGNRGGGQR